MIAMLDVKAKKKNNSRYCKGQLAEYVRPLSLLRPTTWEHGIHGNVKGSTLFMNSPGEIYALLLIADKRNVVSMHFPSQYT